MTKHQEAARIANTVMKELIATVQYSSQWELNLQIVSELFIFQSERCTDH